jgi:glycosyltransferase involved in cell wall biosynthesis
VPWKRHLDFLEALALVRKSLPNTVGLLVGSDLFRQNDGYSKELLARAEYLGLDAHNLRVLDQRNDIPELLAASDVLVSPSENEPFGRVLAEAGAAGLPVVASNSGAKAEIIEHGKTGLLVAQNAPEALAAGCLELLRNPAQRLEMGVRARERVSALFDVRRSASELTQILIEAARGSK